MIAFLLNPGGRRRRRRRNAWRGHKRAHRLAAIRGWSKRRRRRGSGKARRRGRKARGRRRGSRGYRRGRRRSRMTKWQRRLWYGKTSPELAAARSSYAAERSDRLPSASERGYQKVANRRRRRRKSVFDDRPFNMKTGRREGRKSGWKKRRRRNPSWVPAYAMNPSWVPAYAMNPGLKAIPGTLMRQVLPASIGLFSSMSTTYLLAKIPYIGQYFGGGGVVGVLTSIGSAALTAALIGIAKPGWVAPAFIGGLMGVGLTVAKQYIMPTVSKLTGLGDYLTVQNARDARPLGQFTRQDAIDARPLGCYGCGSGMGLVDTTWDSNNWQINDTPEDLASQNPFTLGTEFTQPINPEQMDAQLPYSAGLGDYLTVQNARDARPLGYMGHTMNDAAIEGVATMELGS
jgi:hypothetical protein